MTIFAYSRVSTSDQSVESHKHQIEQAGYKIDYWHCDTGISGTVKALDRPGFSQCFNQLRTGETLVVPAIDRLGRGTVDVLTTVQALQDKGVRVVSVREGFDLSTPMGKAMLTMLAAVAELERSNIRARQMAGIERARAEGRNLGRPSKIDKQQVAEWRRTNNASIQTTANHFGISPASVKNACRVA